MENRILHLYIDNTRLPPSSHKRIKPHPGLHNHALRRIAVSSLVRPSDPIAPYTHWSLPTSRKDVESVLASPLGDLLDPFPEMLMVGGLEEVVAMWKKRYEREVERRRRSLVVKRERKKEEARKRRKEGRIGWNGMVEGLMMGVDDGMEERNSSETRGVLPPLVYSENGASIPGRGPPITELNRSSSRLSSDESLYSDESFLDEDVIMEDGSIVPRFGVRSRRKGDPNGTDGVDQDMYMVDALVASRMSEDDDVQLAKLAANRRARRRSVRIAQNALSLMDADMAGTIIRNGQNSLKVPSTLGRGRKGGRSRGASSNNYLDDTQSSSSSLKESPWLRLSSRPGDLKGLSRSTGGSDSTESLSDYRGSLEWELDEYELEDGKRIWKPGGGNMNARQRAVFLRNRERARQFGQKPQRPRNTSTLPSKPSPLSHHHNLSPEVSVESDPNNPDIILPSLSPSRHVLVKSRPTTGKGSGLGSSLTELPIYRPPSANLGDRLLYMMEAQERGSGTLYRMGSAKGVGGSMGNVRGIGTRTNSQTVMDTSYMPHPSDSSPHHSLPRISSPLKLSPVIYERQPLSQDVEPLDTSTGELPFDRVSEVSRESGVIPLDGFGDVIHGSGAKEHEGMEKAKSGEKEGGLKSVRKRIARRVPRPLADFEGLRNVGRELEDDPQSEFDAAHAIKRTFLNDFVSIETKHTALTQNETDLTSRDMNAVGTRFVDQLTVPDVVVAVWNLVRYLDTMSAPIVSEDVGGSILGIVEMDVTDEDREEALRGVVWNVPRDDFVVMKGVIGHVRRLIEMSPYEIVRGLCSTIGYMLIPTPGDFCLKRPPASVQREDWETAVAQAAAALEEARVLDQTAVEGAGVGNGPSAGEDVKGVMKRRASMIVQMASNRQLQELAARVVKSVEDEEGENVDEESIGGGGTDQSTDGKGGEGEGVAAQPGNGTDAVLSNQPPPPPRRASLSIPGFRTDFPLSAPIILPPLPTPRRLGSKQRFSVATGIQEETVSDATDDGTPGTKSPHEGRPESRESVPSVAEETNLRLDKREMCDAMFLADGALSSSGLALMILVEGYEGIFMERERGGGSVD
ncbi:hypothetical protein HDV00_002354 [Rhizophlyctis rosea]|nr:hypothetical protein HDV00_002354 [Rhizophlyctis rosea]